MVLCGSNSYNQKYYLDKQFEKLPTKVKEELKIMCVLFTEEVGGTITFEYDEDGELEILTGCDEGDLLYDEIGAGLLVKKLRSERQEFFEALELYYKVFINGEAIDGI
ncbi:MAG: DUF6145 family protein [Lachnospiraceae bacterium]|nr:DUF6145 family protein [Lachnospiraceae bacterium]